MASSPSKGGAPAPGAIATSVRARQRRPARVGGPDAISPQFTPEVRAAANNVLADILYAHDQATATACLDAARSIICSADFGDLRAELTFRALEELAEEGVAIAAPLVAERITAYDRAEAAFKIHGGEPLTYFALELSECLRLAEPTVTAWHARLVARAASDYRARLAGEQLAELAKGDPDAFWTHLQAIAAEHAQQGQQPEAHQILEHVRLGEFPDPGPTRWLIKDLWTENAFGIVGAEPKSWKSWLTLYLGICVASGTRVFNRFDVEQGRVLVFSAEGGPGLARQRAGALCRAMGLDLATLDIDIITRRSLRLDKPETVELLHRTVEQLRPALLILDPLRKLHTGDENDAGAVEELLAPLFDIQAATSCAIMIVHHMGKAPSVGKDARRQGQRLRGSSAFHGATDSALYLSASGEGKDKTVVVTPEHRGGVEPESITLALHDRETPDGMATWLEIVDEESEEAKDTAKVDRASAAHDKARKAVLRAIRNACLPGRDPLKSKRAVVEASKVRAITVRALIDLLLEEKAITVRKDGGYQVVEGVEDAA